MPEPVQSLGNALAQADRSALAQAITLIESTRADHQQEAQQLLQTLLPKTGHSIRIGITGVPGVGKSTFIEAFGLHAIAEGHKVAVLAIDPSSARSGGSILGDKTRMSRLAQHKDAYIRPSPAGGTLGGVARRTREAMLVCEAAGYDVVIVETVGVGQSETEVADMVDMFVLMLLPGSGDELQGIKRGIIEMADLVAVNKADGDLLAQAKRVRADYAAALKMLTPPDAPWQPKVELCSALSGSGIGEIWTCVQDFEKHMRGSGELERQRAGQARVWMWKEVRETLMEHFCTDKRIIRLVPECEEQVAEGKITAAQAARKLLDTYFGNT